MPDPASSKKKRYRIDFLCQGSIKTFPWKDKFDKMAHQLLDQEGTASSTRWPTSSLTRRGRGIM